MLLAAAELHATENDLYAARKCIARAFSIYGNPDEANSSMFQLQSSADNLM